MKNDYEVRGDITAIYVKKSKEKVIEVIVNTCDLSKIQSFHNSWRLFKNHQNHYVVGDVYEKGKKSVVLLHRWIMNPPEHMVIDHINRNTLDNTRSNLRIITKGQNSQNRGPNKKHTSSGIRGVSWDKNRKKWVAQVRAYNKFLEIGRFDNIKDAEKAVVEARKIHLPYSYEG